MHFWTILPYPSVQKHLLLQLKLEWLHGALVIDIALDDGNDPGGMRAAGIVRAAVVGDDLEGGGGELAHGAADI